MAKQVKHRRGTTAEHATFIGAIGEITVDTNLNTAVVHDAVTPGGHRLLLEENSGFSTYEIAVSPGQTIIAIPPPFLPNTNSLMFHMGGSRITGLTENEDLTITLDNAVPEGITSVVVDVLKTNPVGVTDSSNVSYTTGTVKEALDERLVTVATMAELKASTGLSLGKEYNTTSYYGGWAATIKGPQGGGRYTVVTKAQHDSVRGTATVNELTDHTLPDGNVLLLHARTTVDASQAGAVGDGTDSSDAFNAVLGLGRKTTFSGEHIVHQGVLKSNTFLEGITSEDGNKAKLVQIAGAGGLDFVLAANIGDGGTTSLADNLKNITLKNFIVEGHIATESFVEHCHLISVSAVTGVLVEEVDFIGFKGDGLYIASGNYGGDERHNAFVTVRHCSFDGVNRDNRNGISVIDCDNFTFEYCKFENCTRPNMPGPIDLEPDPAVYHIIRNGRIAHNYFANNGGNVGEIVAHIPTSVVETFRNVTIEDNHSHTYVGTGAMISLNTQRTVTNTSERNDIKILNNRGRNGASRPFQLFSLRGVELSGNEFYDFQQDALLGFVDADDGLIDVISSDNVFERCGIASQIGMSVFTISEFDSNNDHFIDCGNGASGSYAIDFNAGVSSGVRFKGLQVSSPTGKTLFAIQKEAGHTFNAASNEALDCNLNGLGTNFQAFKTNGETPANVFTGATLPTEFPLGLSRASVNATAGMPATGYSQGIIESHNYDPTSEWHYQIYTARGNNAGRRFMRHVHSNGLGWKAWHQLTSTSEAYSGTHEAAHTGAHDGAADAAVLTDTTEAWTVDELVGLTVLNTTDGSSAIITSNTATTITGTLSGGTDNDWDVGDAYSVVNLEVLTDSTASWAVNHLVGRVLLNTTDGSSTVVTANTATTITGVLSGGAENDWDIGDGYSLP